MTVSVASDPGRAARLAITALVLGTLAALPALPALPARAGEGRLTVERQRLDDRKAVYATVESVDALVARTRIGGTVGGLTVDEGDAVEAGEVIAVVGDPKLMLQLQSLDAGIASVQAERSQARIDLDRAQTLFRQGVVAKARLDQARTAVQVLDKTIASLRAERSVVAQQSKEGQVEAPGRGRVLEVKVTDGTVVLPGEVVAAIASGNYVLRMELPERHARFLREGDEVLVGPRGLDRRLDGGDLRQGSVVQVYPRLRQGRVVADVTAEGLGDYFVGERAVVFVATGQRQAIVLPEAYLSTRYGVTYATLADGTDVVVQTGGGVDGGIEVLSGLREGDVVVPPSQGPATEAATAGDGAP
jgi:RND family efflux transporter MFP subunit